ncbi:hypothetical protein JCM8547_000737 [Rhodosporidiobolus lusitaniae]
MSMQSGQPFKDTPGGKLVWTAAVVLLPFAQPVACFFYVGVSSWKPWVDLVLLLVSFGGLSGVQNKFEGMSMSDIGLQVSFGTGLPYLLCIALAISCIFFPLWLNNVFGGRFSSSSQNQNNQGYGGGQQEGMYELSHGRSRRSKRARMAEADSLGLLGRTHSYNG